MIIECLQAEQEARQRTTSCDERIRAKLDEMTAMIKALNLTVVGVEQSQVS